MYILSIFKCIPRTHEKTKQIIYQLLYYLFKRPLFGLGTLYTLIRVHGPSEHSAERDEVEIEIITPDFLTLKRNVYRKVANSRPVYYSIFEYFGGSTN